jgi:hypothetical protein
VPGVRAERGIASRVWEDTTMPDNPNELTIENSALVLIDHQPMVAFSVHSMPHSLLINNVALLARAARALSVPTVLTTVGAQGSVLVDPIFKEISEAFPETTPIDRTSTMPGRTRASGPLSTRRAARS